ncbi:unnamed protein product [Gongylonema pulchrum]|uniref:Ovule protein n=1 Tax=Gongylonema pulchrum TaxID=637853 RepID=A0A183D9Z0_9BILA|nr:unnamed protein product [Gongylonema pulchrum]
MPILPMETTSVQIATSSATTTICMEAAIATQILGCITATTTSESQYPWIMSKILHQQMARQQQIYYYKYSSKIMLTKDFNFLVVKPVYVQVDSHAVTSATPLQDVPCHSH